MELHIENNVLLGFEKYTMWKEDEYIHVVVPSTVTEIKLPKSLIYLDEAAFRDSYQMEKVWLPEHLKDQVESMFRDVYPEVEYICY